MEEFFQEELKQEDLVTIEMLDDDAFLQRQNFISELALKIEQAKRHLNAASIDELLFKGRSPLEFKTFSEGPRNTLNSSRGKKTKKKKHPRNTFNFFDDVAPAKNRKKRKHLRKPTRKKKSTQRRN